MKSTYYKGRNGYAAEAYSETTGNGKQWKIHTGKDRNAVTCEATEGQDGGGMWTCDIFGAKRLQLASLPGNCTEAKVKEVHEIGLKAFAEQMKEEKSEYLIELGQVIFTDGLERERRRAVYEIEGPGRYKTVLLDGSGFEHDTHVDPITERFGIGSYYREGDKIGYSEVQELVILATISKQQREQKRIEDKANAEKERQQKIDIGRNLISEIPAGVVSVIVGENCTNTSDIQSDYHGHTVDEVIYLAWSAHKRDLFPEMRKAAERAEQTNHLGTGKGVFTPYVANDSKTDFILNGHQFAGAELRRVGGLTPDEIPAFQTEAEAREWCEANPLKFETIQSEAGEQIPLIWKINSEEIEHRQKYSMGSGYWLGVGHSDSSGWKVKKQSLPSLETLQIAAAEGRFFCAQGESQEPAQEFEAVAVEAGTIQIIDYSEKAIAVIGDTKPIKDLLGRDGLGGKFNARLSCGAGWIFSKKKLAEVTQALQAYTSAAPKAEKVTAAAAAMIAAPEFDTFNYAG